MNKDCGDTERDAYFMGKLAAARGRALHDCPYSSAPLRTSWRLGYLEALKR